MVETNELISGPIDVSTRYVRYGGDTEIKHRREIKSIHLLAIGWSSTWKTRVKEFREISSV